MWNAARRRNSAWLSAEIGANQRAASGRWPLVIGALITLTFLLFGLITGVMVASRTPSQPPAVDLPSAYLPGSPIPKDVSGCHMDRDIRRSVCSLRTSESGMIYFEVDEAQRTIIQTRIWVSQVTLGQLILVWGTPTGFESRNHKTTLYWERRSAEVYSAVLKPNTPVNDVTYTLKSPVMSPWPGFGMLKSSSL